MIKLGDKVRDTITGFSGVVICRCEYRNGCVQFQVQPQELHEGKPISTQWVDVQQLVVLESDASAPWQISRDEQVDPKFTRRVGGPQDHPPVPARP